MGDDKRIRGKKTSVNQMTILVNLVQFLEENRILVTGKCHPLATKELEEKWDELVKILNAVPNGARKDKQWKNFLYEWKSKTKKKAREIKDLLTKTGGGSYSSDELTDLENRLVGVLGWGTVTGCEELPPDNVDEDIYEDIAMESETIEITVIESDENQEDTTIDDKPFSMDIPIICPETMEKKTKEDSLHGKVKTGTPKKSTRRDRKPGPTQLERSAEMYSKSTEEMAVAVSKMADSITALSVALSEIAVAICQLKDK